MPEVAGRSLPNPIYLNFETALFSRIGQGFAKALDDGRLPGDNALANNIIEANLISYYRLPNEFEIARMDQGDQIEIRNWLNSAISHLAQYFSAYYGGATPRETSVGEPFDGFGIFDAVGAAFEGVTEGVQNVAGDVGAGLSSASTISQFLVRYGPALAVGAVALVVIPTIINLTKDSK